MPTGTVTFIMPAGVCTCICWPPGTTATADNFCTCGCGGGWAYMGCGGGGGGAPGTIISNI